MYQKSYWISVAGLTVGIVLLALATAFNSEAVGWFGGIVIVLSELQTLVFHRCPSCMAYVRPMIPPCRHCPHCGESLE